VLLNAILQGGRRQALDDPASFSVRLRK